MRPWLTAAEARRVDLLAEQAGILSITLMERAGQESALAIQRELPDAWRVARVLAGVGHNGGDGLVVARALWQAGADASVLLVGDPQRWKGDAARMAWRAAEAGVPMAWAQDVRLADWLPGWLSPGGALVDAVLGTGHVLGRGLPAPFAAVHAALRDTPMRVVALDLPSGMDADLGVCEPFTLSAELTLTAVLPKAGMLTELGLRVCGRVVCVPIGVEDSLVLAAQSR